MAANPGPRCPVPVVCRILSSNVLDLAVASSQYDIQLCSETLVLDMRHVSELLVRRFGRLSCAGAICLGPEGWLHIYEMAAEHSQPKFEYGCCKILVFKV